jgi:DNA-binding NtrC family response regulator
MNKPIRVLIVEDSADDAAILLRMLHHAGYEVVQERVETADAMRAALEKQVWDIVLSDHKMPHFSSEEALALLRDKGLDVPFIIVSGSIGEEAAVAVMKAGAHDYITKGNLARLSPAIERELRDAEVRLQRKRTEEVLRRRSEELARSNAELAWFNRVAAGRELRMIELKQKVNDLSRQLGQPAPYAQVDLSGIAMPEGSGEAAVSKPPEGGEPAWCPGQGVAPGATQHENQSRTAPPQEGRPS